MSKPSGIFPTDNEATVLSKVRLAAAPYCTLHRNNIGKLQDKNGRWIAYGVCNPGGSDLIGWQSITITPEMVGMKIAKFVALECKTETGRPTTDQIRFLENVSNAGGLASIVRSETEALALLRASIAQKMP